MYKGLLIYNSVCTNGDSKYTFNHIYCLFWSEKKVHAYKIIIL